MSRPPISIPSTYDMDWQTIVLDDGTVTPVVTKPLSTDPESGSFTFLMHLPPGWNAGSKMEWHPATEEAFKLGGSGQTGDRVSTLARSYIFRPAGLLHGPTRMSDDLGATFLMRHGGHLRVYFQDGGVQDDSASPEYSAEGLVWLPDIEQLPWRDVGTGVWSGVRVRELRRDRHTGGGVFLLDLPAGWEGEGSRARGVLEEFVVSGSVQANGVRYTEWGYASRPAGRPAGRYASDNGALLLFWADANELD